jgi:hypothetical protein
MKCAIGLSILVLVPAFFPADGFGQRPPRSDPKFLTIGQIEILPVVDARAGKRDKVDLDKYLRGTAQKNLKSKNYAVSLSDSTGVGDMVEEDLNEAKPDWIKRLGPSEARWVMVLGVRDVHSKTTFGSTGNAEVFGFLYDKDSGSTLWKGEGQGKVGQGGLMGMAMKGVMSASAIQMATTNLLSEIPKLPKTKK